MQKKLTITIDETVYDALYRMIGARNISRFIESLVRPHVIKSDLEAGYRAMAEDEQYEAEAFEWIEAVIGDAIGSHHHETLVSDTSRVNRGEVSYVAG